MKERIEFYVTPDGKVLGDDGDSRKELTENDYQLVDRVAEMIRRLYPDAFKALEEIYEKYSRNRRHFMYLIVHRFIRCNFGKFDGLHYDIDGDVMYLEDVSCPLKNGECPMRGVVCMPRPFGLSKRESEIAKLRCTGASAQEISDRIGIKKNTISSYLLRIKKKLNLSSVRDVNKLILATCYESR